MELTNRQRQMLPLVCAGQQNKEIAHALGITTGTVKQYMYGMMQLIGVANRAQLAVWAVRQNLDMEA